MRQFIKYSCILILTLLFTACSIFGQSGKVRGYSENVSSDKTRKETGTKSEKDAETEIFNGDDLIRINTDLVIIPTKILDKKGRTVSGIREEEFKIFENNVEQEIAYFSDAEQPFTVALILDMSYSSIFKIEEIRNAAMTFIGKLRPDDKVMVASFDEKIHILCEPTNNQKVLRLAVEGTQISSGTSLYSALNTVLEEKLKAITGRKAIVLLSDGVDTTSKNLTDKLVLEKFNTSNVLVFPIQYNTFDDVQRNKKFTTDVIYDDYDRPIIINRRKKGETVEDYDKASDFLKSLANQTSGKVYRVSSKTNLDRAFSNIADELRKIYSLGYYPTSERKKGDEFRIKIRVYRPNLNINARDKIIWGQKNFN